MKENKSNSKLSLLTRWKNRDKMVTPNKKITKAPENAKNILSKEQKRLWFLQQLNPTNSFYNYAELYKLEGDINIKFFEKSIRLIEEKHDILRASFPIKAGEPFVDIALKSNSKFNFYDFSKESPEISTQKAKDIIQNKANHTFQLANEPLLQTTVIKKASQSYLFLIVKHHIITDKWSMKVFREELAENYKNLLKGQLPKINKLELQYTDYAYWQANQKINKKHLSYWKSKLSGEITTLNLNTDFPKKIQPSYKGKFHKQTYSQETTKAFFKLCNELQATPYATMLSVYYILLNKYTQQQDILIGTPITKREQTNLENLIGFFNDTLVLRSFIDKTNTFHNLVKEVKKTVLDAFEHKDISFDTLVKELKPKRTLNLHPFFQVMFLYHKVPETPKFGNNIKIAYEPYDAGVAKFDLTLYISESKDSLFSLMEYETDLFESSTIERMHQHFGEILKEVIKKPDVIISNISTETSLEKDFYKTFEIPEQKSIIPDKGIHEIIVEQAKENPYKIALTFKDVKINYETLDRESDKIATELLKRGVQKNTIIGLCVTRSQKMIFGLLGILKAGAAYLPLDSEYPKERTNYILKDASIKFVITEEKILEKFTNLNATTITLESIEKTEINSKIDFPKVFGDDLAYVIYTSGSTGKPKGVSISHENIINSTIARNKFYSSKPFSFLLMSSISFDSSKAGIFWTLCTGGTLVISKNNLEQDIDDLCNVIYKNKVSHTLMLPSLYSQLINYGTIEKLKSLGTVIVAGETCKKELVNQHFSTLSSINLYNEYGPTESTVWCTAHKIKPEDSTKNSIPIGKPIQNVQVFILDNDLHKVPYGAVGELYIGGSGLSKGYINDRKKTKELFLNYPNNNKKIIYKTGDLARYTSDGTIEFLGRKDHQIKIRGYRIELQEIENQIYKNKEVQQAVVTMEDEIDSISWEKFKKENTPKLASLLQKHIPENELEEILKSVENISEETIESILNKIE